ncbi:MAG TPA: heme exporter protein CcmB [Stellaceae bacterium]|nr:heme exporter protein CcmB [Stellaceae bacterium]
MNVFAGLICHELRLALRQGADTALVLGFFVLAIVLFPLGVGPEPELLRRIGPGIIWTAALLAALLSLDRLFRVDYEDGSLELIALSSLPLEFAALAKCAAHWLMAGLPLVVASPFLALLVDIRPRAIPVLVLSLLLGTPGLSLVGGVAAALTLGARRQGILLALLVLPLYVPSLIFGAGASEAAARADLLLLAAFSLGALALAPWAAAAALRQALE